MTWWEIRRARARWRWCYSCLLIEDNHRSSSLFEKIIDKNNIDWQRTRLLSEDDEWCDDESWGVLFQEKLNRSTKHWFRNIEIITKVISRKNNKPCWRKLSPVPLATKHSIELWMYSTFWKNKYRDSLDVYIHIYTHTHAHILSHGYGRTGVFKGFCVIFIVEDSLENVVAFVVGRARQRHSNVTCAIIFIGIGRTENIQESAMFIVDRVDLVNIRLIGIENGGFRLRADARRSESRTEQFVLVLLLQDIVSVQMSLSVENFDQAEHVWMIVKRYSMMTLDDEDAHGDDLVFVEFHVEDGRRRVSELLEIQLIDRIDRLTGLDLIEENKIQVGFADLVHRTFHWVELLLLVRIREKQRRERLPCLFDQGRNAWWRRLHIWKNDQQMKKPWEDLYCGGGRRGKGLMCCEREKWNWTALINVLCTVTRRGSRHRLNVDANEMELEFVEVTGPAATNRERWRESIDEISCFFSPDSLRYPQWDWQDSNRLYCSSE